MYFLTLQEVCEHFEGTLKIMNLLKQLVSSIPGVGGTQLRATGFLVFLPDMACEDLGSAIHSLCVELIRHIVGQAQPFLASLSPHSKERKSKEVCISVHISVHMYVLAKTVPCLHAYSHIASWHWT